MIHHGTTRSRGAAFKKQVQGQALVISSYAVLHRDVEMLHQMPWSASFSMRQKYQEPGDQEAKAARCSRRLSHRPHWHAGGEQRR